MTSRRRLPVTLDKPACRCYNTLRNLFVERGIDMDRNRIIVRTSIIGILANVFLAGFKAVVGVVSGSIAIVLDAVNNLSDALSSVITIIGTKLASRRPDRDHPYGHGRIEYLSATIISVIVLYAGVTSLVESVKKILHPGTPDYSAAALIIVASAVVVKLVLGRYVRSVGEKVKSGALVDSGKDAVMDAVISASTLAAAVIFLLWHISLEAWLGAVISLVIIKSGIEMLSESLSDILGKRVDSEIAKGVKQTVAAFPGVHGAYDLVVHNYGPDLLIGSIHIEVDDTMTAGQLDTLEREITQAVISEHKVILTGIGVYSTNTTDDFAGQILRDVRRIAMSKEFILQMHGFYVDVEKKLIRFDVIVDYAAPDAAAIHGAIVDEVKALYPEYDVQVTLDVDVSD